MPRTVLRVVLGLVCVAGALGLWLGTRHAPVSETEVISAIADRYVAETGGARSDCVARPGQTDGVWMVINCGTASSISQYIVDRQGRLITPDGMPQT